jgi:hypothetical protein
VGLYALKMKIKFQLYLLIPIAFLWSAINPVFSSEPTLTVWKSASCGCCQKWVEYMKDNGFKVISNNVENVLLMKEKLGITNPALHSCHTAEVDGYLIEGHVPASDVRRLLAERPNIVGLTAPGMPQMSPGMGSVNPRNYDVLQFNSHQRSSVFSSY